MGGEAAKRADHRPGGLEPEREDADEEVASGGQLGGLDRRLADPRQLGEHVLDRRHGHVRVDRGTRRERPGARRMSKPAPAP